MLVEVCYGDGEPEIYMMPGSGLATGEEIERVKTIARRIALLQVRTEEGQKGVLYGAIWNPAFATRCLTAPSRNAAVCGGVPANWSASHTRSFRKVVGRRATPTLKPSVQNAEQQQHVRSSMAIGSS